jgi:hypothetical protein
VSEVHFVEIRANERVIQTVDFDSDGSVVRFRFFDV